MARVMRSSALSFAFGYVLFAIVALLSFAAPLWYAWQVTMQDGRAELLQVDAQRLVETFNHSGVQGLVTFIDARVGMQIAGERILLFTDAKLNPLAGNLSAWPKQIPDAPGTYTIEVELDGETKPAVFVHAKLAGGYNLLVGRDLARFTPLEHHFWYGLTGAVAILAIVGVVGGVSIRRRLLARIDTIDQTVSAIVRGDLSHRLKTRSTGDELEALSHTLNRMLEQIEHLVHGVRNVSNSIAHDLRTPLAELRSRLEELLLTRPSVDETFAEIDTAVTDVDRVIGIFNALLRLAEIDTGLRRSGFVAVDVAQVATEAVEFYLPAAELKNVSLEFRDAGAVPMAGDPLLLAQAINNLIDNALKYSAANGSIVVEVKRRSDNLVEICVADNGPGITDTEKPKVAERFYRGDASRGSQGMGLGLSIVAAVAKLHEGELVLVDNSPGLRAQMLLR